MRRPKLDKIDRKILRNLQKNGRITNVELAKNVGISAPPCLRRVRTLEDTGYIRGYYTKINGPALGYGVTVFAMVKLESQGGEGLGEFEKLVKSWDKVRECHLLAGDVDFLLRIVARVWEDYEDFLSNHLTKAPNVVSVKSSLTIRTAKEESGVPIEL